MKLRLDSLGDRLREQANEVINRLQFPGQITGLGSTFRLHMTDRELIDYRSTLLNDMQEKMKHALYFDLLAKGIFIATSGMGCLSTPMDDSEIGHFLQALEDSLKDLKENYL